MYYVSFPIANIVKWSHRNLDSLNCQTMKVKPCIILNTSRKHVNYEEDKNKVPMNKPYNIQNKNICNGIFHISVFKALLQWYFHISFFKVLHVLINEGETTRGKRLAGRNDPDSGGADANCLHRLALSAGKLNLPLVPSQDYVLQDNKRCYDKIYEWLKF